VTGALSPDVRRRAPGLPGRLEWGLLAAGGAASALLQALPPDGLLPDGHQFHGTLAAIPLVLAALAVIARRTEAAGGRRLRPRPILVEAVVLALLVTAILAHRGLGLSAAGPALAAGLFALLGVHAIGQTVALRPLLGTGSGNRQGRASGAPSILFFVLPLTVYCALVPWAAANRQPDGDEPYYLLLAHSAAYDQDVDLANNYENGDWRYFMDRPIEPQPGDPRGPNGEIYSRHDAPLPVLVALPYRLGGRRGVLAAMSVFAAALAWAGLRLAGRFAPGRPGAALLAYGALAFTPPLLLYAHQVWVEVPAALAVAVAYERSLARPSEGRTADRFGLRRWLPLAAALVALPLLKLRFALIAAPLALVALLRSAMDGKRRRWAVIGAVALLVTALGVVLAINQARFGNALKIHTWQELDLPDFPVTSYAEGFLGLFWDAAFGLFFFAPLWLLVLPALILVGARSRRLVAEVALIALPYLVIMAPRAEWYGGWSPPFRYGVVLLPLLCALLAPLLAERHRPGARALLAALGLATAGLALVWLALPGWTYDLADGRTRLLDALSASTAADAARFFPSYVRPRLASWIWPPASALLVTLLWWRPRWRGTLARSLPRRRTPAAAGAVLLLAGLALLPLAARTVPTRVVDLEDPWLDHRGGHLQPEPWVVARSHYRGGWVIRPYEEVRVPLVPGGDRLEIVLDIHLGRNNPDPLSLAVGAGDQHLADWTPERDGWSRVTLGPFDWPAGETPAGGEAGGAPSPGSVPLVLRAVGPPRAGRQNGFLVDRVELRWE